MNRAILDFYSNVLLSSFWQAAATRAAALTDHRVSHDRVIRTNGHTVKGMNLLSVVYHRLGTTLPVGYEIVKKTKSIVDEKTGKERRVSEETKNDLFRRQDFDELIVPRLEVIHLLQNSHALITAHRIHVVQG